MGMYQCILNYDVLDKVTRRLKADGLDQVSEVCLQGLHDDTGVWIYKNVPAILLWCRRYGAASDRSAAEWEG